MAPIWCNMVFIETGESVDDKIMFQFQLVPWKSDKQKSVVVFFFFSFPCHNSAAVQGYFGAMRTAVEDKKNRGSKARQAEKKWYNKRGREKQKARERKRESTPSQIVLGSLSSHKGYRFLAPQP